MTSLRTAFFACPAVPRPRHRGTAKPLASNSTVPSSRASRVRAAADLQRTARAAGFHSSSRAAGGDSRGSSGWSVIPNAYGVRVTRGHGHREQVALTVTVALRRRPSVAPERQMRLRDNRVRWLFRSLRTKRMRVRVTRGHGHRERVALQEPAEHRVVGAGAEEIDTEQVGLLCRRSADRHPGEMRGQGQGLRRRSSPGARRQPRPGWCCYLVNKPVYLQIFMDEVRRWCR